MKPKIGIIDYGVGNIFSVQQACNQAGMETDFINDPTNLKKYQALILPGVGSYATAMANLNSKGFIGPFNEYIKSGRYFIGICLGMQLLLTKSLEFGVHQGLNIIEGTVEKFKQDNNISYAIPQIQWNKIKKYKDKIDKPLSHFIEEDYMYFVHSYYCNVINRDTIVTTTEYCGIEYPSIIRQNNVIGMQFHPEKSGKNGLIFYKELKELIIEQHNYGI